MHSGDSACTIPPYSLAPRIVESIKDQARRLAKRLRVRGLMNLQLAVKDEEIYILEVNPRASRTAPFVSKAKGVPWPHVAAKVMMGASLSDLGIGEVPDSGFYAVKESVFPFSKFPGVDVILGPEMRSTGEVMGADRSLPLAFAKACMAAGLDLPTEGTVFLSVRDGDKPHAVEIARGLRAMDFRVLVTSGTHEHLKSFGVETEPLPKISEGLRPNILDLIADGDVDLILNTATRKGAHTDEGRIRAEAVKAGSRWSPPFPGPRRRFRPSPVFERGTGPWPRRRTTSPNSLEVRSSPPTSRSETARTSRWVPFPERAGSPSDPPPAPIGFPQGAKKRRPVGRLMGGGHDPAR